MQRSKRLAGREPLRDEGGDDRADARPAHPVDRNVRLGERAEHAQMRESARTAAAEHEADAGPGEAAREAGEVLRPVHADVVVAVDLPRRKKRRRVARRGNPGIAQEDEAAPRGARGPPPRVETPLGLSGLGRRRGIGDEHHVIGLADGPLGPVREQRIGLVEHELVRELLLVQPLDEPRARRILAPRNARSRRARARGPRAGHPGGACCRAGRALRQAAAPTSAASASATGGHDGERPHHRSRAPRRPRSAAAAGRPGGR